jgi:hypothetical protein
MNSERSRFFKRSDFGAVAQYTYEKAGVQAPIFSISLDNDFKIR